MKVIHQSPLIKAAFRSVFLVTCLISGGIVLQRSIIIGQMENIVHISPYLFLLKLRILFAFLLAAIFAWRFKLWRLIVSMLFLLWVLVEHGTWYLRSQDGLKFADIKQLPPPSTLGFEGATGWDISLLVGACILLIGEIFLIYREAVSLQKKENTLKL